MAHTIEIVDGILYSSGDNQYGQLGIGNVFETSGKQVVLTGDNNADKLKWVSFSKGLFHTIAIKEDATIWVWGSNKEGQSGVADSEIKYVTKPKKIIFPFPLDTKATDINLNSGSYFSIAWVRLGDAYGLGEFQNLYQDAIGVYSTPEKIYYLDKEDKWLSVQTGPKTIYARIFGGNPVIADWSGTLFPKTYTTFESLEVGDIFTLYDPANRNRVLYKKINTFSFGPGCCKANAVCLFRKYKELRSSSPINEQTFTTPFGDNLASLLSNTDGTITSKEQYGTDFIFTSAMTGLPYMNTSADQTMDIFTLQGFYLITGKTNLLDIIFYDSLYFDPKDLTQTYNAKTQIEKISAKEIFEKGDFPEYLLDKDKYHRCYSEVISSSETSVVYAVKWFKTNPLAKSAPKLSARTNTNFYGLNVNSERVFKYKRKFGHNLLVVEDSVYGIVNGYLKDVINDASTLNLNAYGGSSISRSSVLVRNMGITNIRTLEEDNEKNNVFWRDLYSFTDTPFPSDENNNIIEFDHIISDPILLTVYTNQVGSPSLDPNSGKVLRSNAYDPITASLPAKMIKIENITSRSIVPCENLKAEQGNWMYVCQPPPDRGPIIPVSQPPIPVIGPYARKIIDYFLDENTDPEEVYKFFGYDRFELAFRIERFEKAAILVPNGTRCCVGGGSTPDFDDVLSEFQEFMIRFNSRFNDQYYYTESGTEIYQTGASSTTLTKGYFDYYAPTFSIVYDRNGIRTYDGSQLVAFYNRFAFFITDRHDLNKLYIVGNYVMYFLPQSNINIYYNVGPEHKASKTVIKLDSAVYNAEFTRTELTLQKPFTSDYSIGYQPGSFFVPPVLYLPVVEFNNIFNIEQALNLLTPSKIDD